MANRREAKQSEIDLSLEVHDLALKESKISSSTEPIRAKSYFQSLLKEILTEELGVDPEVHAIFQEAQEQVLVDRSAITGNNITYQLLDDGFAPKNPLCHPEANEDRYDEDSRP